MEIISEEKGLAKYGQLLIAASQPYFESVRNDQEQVSLFVSSVTNLLVDGPGEKYIYPNLSTKDKILRSLFLGFREIENSYEVLQDIPMYLMRFPHKQEKTSKSRYIYYHVTNYLNEVYILRERLVQYQKKVTRAYRKKKVVVGEDQKGASINKLLAGFENIIVVRGRHVHDTRYADEEFDRLKLFEMISNWQEPIIGKIYPLYLREIRKRWVDKLTSINGTTKQILDDYFDILYQVVFDEDGNWISPV